MFSRTSASRYNLVFALVLISSWSGTEAAEYTCSRFGLPVIEGESYFSKMCELSNLPCQQVEERARFDIAADYHADGAGDVPIIVRGVLANSSAMTLWLDDDYLLKMVKDQKMMGKVMRAVVTSRSFMTGHAAFSGKDPLTSLEDPSWLFGSLASDAGKTAYIGQVNISGNQTLLDDIGPMEPHGIGNFIAIWLGTGLFDSGLHVDGLAHGQWLYPVIGSKDVILFPHSDLKYLYFGDDITENPFSTIFLAEELATSDERRDAARTSFPNLWKTKPFIATLQVLSHHSNHPLWLPTSGCTPGTNLTKWRIDSQGTCSSSLASGSTK